MTKSASEYKANRGKSSYVILFAGFIIVFISIAFPIAQASRNGISALLQLLFPIVLGLFFSFVLIGSAIKFMIRYIITDDSLIIKQPLHKNKVFNWNEFEEIKLIDAAVNQEILAKATKEQFQLRENQDIGGFIKMLKEKSPQYNYYTMVTRSHIRTTGNTGHLLSLDVKSEEEIIYARLNDGTFYYFTPKTPQLFYNDCKKRFDNIRKAETR